MSKSQKINSHFNFRNSQPLLLKPKRKDTEKKNTAPSVILVESRGKKYLNMRHKLSNLIDTIHTNEVTKYRVLQNNTNKLAGMIVHKKVLVIGVEIQLRFGAICCRKHGKMSCRTSYFQ